MFPSNVELLRHILEEATFVLDATTGKSKEDVINDPVLHDYFGIDYDIVWDIIKAKLPDLRNNISDIISGN
ncbi:MAG: HepT-like ribonuclease domain-containing protein [Pedobacter sp.]